MTVDDDRVDDDNVDDDNVGDDKADDDNAREGSNVSLVVGGRSRTFRMVRVTDGG